VASIADIFGKLAGGLSIFTWIWIGVLWVFFSFLAFRRCLCCFKRLQYSYWCWLFLSIRFRFNHKPQSSNFLCRSLTHFVSFSAFGVVWLGSSPSPWFPNQQICGMVVLTMSFLLFFLFFYTTHARCSFRVLSPSVSTTPWRYATFLGVLRALRASHGFITHHRIFANPTNANEIGGFLRFADSQHHRFRSSGICCYGAINDYYGFTNAYYDFTNQPTDQPTI